MDKKEKQGYLEVSVIVARIILSVLIGFNAIVLLYFGWINRTELLKKEPFEFIENWTVDDGERDSFVTGRYYIAEKAYQKPVTIYATLPSDIKDNEYLFFATRRDIAVYINDILRKDFVENRDVNIPGGSIKKFYMMVPLKESDSGATVKMVMTSTLKDDELVPETFISTRYGQFSYLMRNCGLSFFLASIVLIFSVVVFIVSVVLRFCYKLNIDMTYGAVGIFVIASWIITDSYLFPYFFGINYVNGIMNYMFCLMIPIAPAIYLNSVQRGRYRKCMTFVLIASVINAIVWPVLHFVNVMPFYNVRNVVNLIFSILAIFVIGLLIYDAVKGYTTKYRYTFIGFFGFLICCMVELSLLLVVKTPHESISMVAGLGFLLTFVVIQQVDDLRNITMEKQRAIDMSEAKTRFLASMSHEIRTPINAILGMNEMILRENNDRVIGEYSKSIKTSGKMLLMLVNDVLDFSRIEAGKLEINESRFRMSEMLYDVISLVKERADEKKLELGTEITDEIPDELVSDEFRIRQVLVNLINNAVKYTERGNVVLVLGGRYTDGDGFELHIAVRDTGKGIRKEDQEHLFEAFTRADEKSNISIEGTGLGLAIVKSIVDSMKGTLGVESEYGVGSEFWIKLPVEVAGKELLKNDFMDKRFENGAEEEKCSFMAPEAEILAVDDNTSNLTIVKLFLKRTGIKPDLCSSGDQALELCRKKKYDLILLDHMMPRPDGIETLHLIREDADSLNKETKAVVLTANAVAGSRQMYMEEGFEDYLTKPLDSGILEQTVMKFLPADKVISASTASDNIDSEADVIEEMSALKKKLTAIEGLDYETALSYCGDDEEFLGEVISDVAAGCAERSERMRKNLEAGDLQAYGIDAHTIKSTMATIGLSGMSERAKKHEFAAKGNDTGFIEKDAEAFITAYTEVCGKLGG